MARQATATGHLPVTSDGRATVASASRIYLSLCGLIAILAFVAAAAGLFYGTDGSAVEVTSVRGETVELHGKGLYQYETNMKTGAYRGSDVLTLAVGIPLLLGAAMSHHRGSLRGSLVLIGVLVYFLYVYASMSLGAAYNQLFLLYVTLFGASLVALVLAFQAALARDFDQRISPAMPRRGPAIFMVVSGVLTLGIWLMDPLSALFGNGIPELLGTGTTLVTHALDIAIIVPAAIAAGVLILRGRAVGYLIAMSLLVLEVMLAPMITLQTIFQVSAGVTFTTAEMIGPIGGFVILALLAIWVLLVILRNIQPAPAGGDLTGWEKQ